jgi:hypothetical protein
MQAAMVIHFDTILAVKLVVIPVIHAVVKFVLVLDLALALLLALPFVVDE